MQGGGSSGRGSGQAFVDIKLKVPSQDKRNFNFRSTKASPRPDGPPCRFQKDTQQEISAFLEMVEVLGAVPSPNIAAAASVHPAVD